MCFWHCSLAPAPCWLAGRQAVTVAAPFAVVPADMYSSRQARLKQKEKLDSFAQLVAAEEPSKQLLGA